MAGLTKAQKLARAKALADAKSREDAEKAASKKSSVPNAGVQADAPTGPAVHDHAPAGETGSKVVVVSKIDRGLYLQLFSPMQQDTRVMGGGIEKRTIHMRMPEKIRLKPTRLPFGVVPNYLIIDGFSINPDIDANFWRAWLEQNKSAQVVSEGLVKAFDDEQSARSYCREYAALKTGLEPISQKDDPRIEKTNNPNLTDVEIDSDSAATRAA